MVGCATCADTRSGPTAIVSLHQYILLGVNMGRGSDRVRMAADVFIPPPTPGCGLAQGMQWRCCLAGSTLSLEED